MSKNGSKTVAKVTIYTKGTRTQKLPANKTGKTVKASGESVKTVYDRTLIEETFIIDDSVPVAKKLAKIQYFATGIIGARCAALVSVGKRLPSKVFFKMEVSGRTYSSETVLTRSALETAVVLSMKSLMTKEGNLLSSTEIINKVRAHQLGVVRSAVEYIANVSKLAAEADKFVGEGSDLGLLEVSKDGGMSVSAPTKAATSPVSDGSAVTA